MSRRRFNHSLRRWAWLFGLAVALLGVALGYREPRPRLDVTPVLAGTVTHVRNGDTIEVAGTPVRIANLDCAEMDTAEGRQARERMLERVRGETLACALEGRMSYDREVGTCALADTGEDLGERLIAEGVCERWRE